MRLYILLGSHFGWSFYRSVFPLSYMSIALRNVHAHNIFLCWRVKQPLRMLERLSISIDFIVVDVISVSVCVRDAVSVCVCRREEVSLLLLQIRRSVQ